MIMQPLVVVVGFKPGRLKATNGIMNSHALDFLSMRNIVFLLL